MIGESAFVSGAAGFLGRHIVDRLQRQGFKVVTIVRPTSDVKYLKEKNVKLVEGDLRDRECIVAAVKGVDVIVHAAASLGGKWEAFQRINVESTLKLLEQAQKENVRRFVYISSIIVYDHSSAAEGFTFSEEMQYEEVQQTYYSKMKIEAEKLVIQFREKHNLPTVILRPGVLFGKYGALFLPRLGFPAGGNSYFIIGNGNLSLPLSHVEGVAKAVSICMEDGKLVGQNYNVLEDQPITQNEFFGAVREFVNPRFSIIKIPYKLACFLARSGDKVLGIVKMKSPLDLLYLRLCATRFYYSNEKIKSELGWSPQKDFRNSIRDMMIWHKEQTLPRRDPPGNGTEVVISSNKNLKVGIIGCGVIAGPHMDALNRLKNVQLAAVCDLFRDAREGTAKKYHIAVTYSDYKEMLEREGLDVVHVCTPVQTHAQASVDAMNKGVMFS